MKEYSFYALLLRMKYIQRWGLMRSSIPENLSEHALETAVIAHALTVIQNTYLGAVPSRNGWPPWPCSMTLPRSSPGICPPR